MEPNKNLVQRGESLDIVEVDSKQRAHLKRRVSCNLMPDPEKRIRNNEANVDG